MTEKIYRVSRELRQRLHQPDYYIILVLLLLVLGGGYYYFLSHRTSLRADAEELALYEDKIKKNPYDGSLLLRSARHHYRVVRSKARDNKVTDSVKSMIVEALSDYRRLAANDDWDLAPEDYFRMSYLYYKLGEGYLGRARRMALRAQQDGYRSPELITLLGNLNHRLGRHEKALEFYRSLGTSTRDPVLLFNWANSLQSAGGRERLVKARKLLERGRSLLADYQGNVVSFELEYRLALARVNLKLGNLQRAERLIKRTARWRDRLDFQVLYAEVLFEAGQQEDARELLREIADHGNAPDRVRVLLENFGASNEAEKRDEN